MSESQKDKDLKVIQTNLEKYRSALENAQEASKQKDRYESELFK